MTLYQGHSVGSTPIPGVKRCGGCGLDKPNNEFYQKGSSRLQSYCIECKVKTQTDLRKLAIAAMREYLIAHGCKDCYTRDIRVLDFDHVCGVKAGNIPSLLGSYSWTSKKVQDEVAKCEVRCANCHRIRHWLQ